MHKFRIIHSILIVFAKQANELWDVTIATIVVGLLVEQHNFADQHIVGKHNAKVRWLFAHPGAILVGHKKDVA